MKALAALFIKSDAASIKAMYQLIMCMEACLQNGVKATGVFFFAGGNNFKSNQLAFPFLKKNIFTSSGTSIAPTGRGSKN